MKQPTELLFELSAKLISVPPYMIEGKIRNSLKLLGELWKFDRITMAEFSDSSQDIKILLSYTARGIPMTPLKRIDEDIPWIIAKLRAGKTVLLPRLPDALPDEASVDRSYCLKERITSIFALPFQIGQAVLGGCFFVTLQKELPLEKAMIEHLRYFAKIFANALERLSAAKRIDELLRFEHLLSEISATYINLPRKQLETVIKNDLGRLGSLLNADRCVIYWLNESKQFRWTLDYMWWPKEDDEYIKSLDVYREQMEEWDFFERFRYLFDQWSKNEIVQFNSLDELPENAAHVKEIYQKFGVKSFLSIPMSVSGAIRGALVLTTVRRHVTWPENLASRLRLFAEVFANGIMRKRNEEEIQSAVSEIKKLKEQIEADYLYLSEEIKLEHNYGDIVGRSHALQRILVKVKQVAPTNAPVLLLGETGTGKGLIARSIHNASQHSNRPLIQVNCAALTPSLIESELFGHEKGAFTGAATRRAGRFELAHGTTLFLDEIGELPLELQPKLLRVLQDGEFERVGGVTTMKADVRIIAATNRDLERDVQEGRFRRDLWYRLSVFPLSIPPLRERLDDIPLFVKWFVDKYSKWSGKKFKMIPQKTLKALRSYSWPGNIRELENLIERAIIISPEGNLQIEMPAPSGMSAESGMTLEEVERGYLIKVLEDTSWIIEGAKGAAVQAGLNPSTLRFRMNKLGIKRLSSPQSGKYSIGD